MQSPTEDDNKVRALRSQGELCERLAQEASDPALAEKLHTIAEKLKDQDRARDRGGRPQAEENR